MPRYFPSRKVFVVGVLAIALLAWSVVYEKTSKQISPAISENILRSVAQAESAFPDLDEDGLFDWEEELYETDPSNPDSDGDGVLDGEQYLGEKKELGIRISDSIYLAINRLGEDVENAFDPIKSLSTSPIVYENPFSKKDLHVVESNNATKKEYIEEAFLILSEHEEVVKINPIALLEEWLQTKNPETLNEINAASDKVKQVSYLLLEIHVPENYVDLQLSLANNLFLSGISLNDIKVTTDDPTGGFFATANYVNYQSKYMDSFFELIGINEPNE